MFKPFQKEIVMEAEKGLVAYYTMDGLDIKYNGRPNKVVGDTENEVREFFKQISEYVGTNPNKFILMVDRTEKPEGTFFLGFYNPLKEGIYLKQLTDSFWSEVNYYPEKNENVTSNTIRVTNNEDKIFVIQIVEMAKGQPVHIEEIIDFNEKVVDPEPNAEQNSV